MNIILFNRLGLDSYNNIAKIYLNMNSDLLTNIDFMKETFTNACIKSNLELVKYLSEKCPSLFLFFDNNYLNNLFDKMCGISNLTMIKWYLENFKFLDIDIDIDGNNYTGLKYACVNQNIEVLKWLCEEIKFIPKHIYEYMFKISLTNINLHLLKFIFNRCPNINLVIMNGIMLPHIFPPDLINNIIEWLKNITDKNYYTLSVLEGNQLRIIDNFVITKSKTINLLDTEYDEICQLCIENKNCIISNCEHVFCSYCIRQWIKKNNSCPYCRKSDDIEFYNIKTN